VPRFAKVKYVEETSVAAKVSLASASLQFLSPKAQAIRSPVFTAPVNENLIACLAAILLGLTRVMVPALAQQMHFLAVLQSSELPAVLK
jgi:hypothetical protein